MYQTTCLISTVFIGLSILKYGLATPNSNASAESCGYWYEKGVESYLENNYAGCVLNFENALEKYRTYTKKLQNCRIKCAKEAELIKPLYPTDIENLHFFEKSIRNTLCILKCKSENEIFGRFNINKETEELFENLKPYEYLHICYFQTDEVQKAASAAYTYLVQHPKDETTISNMKFYSKTEGVDMKEIVNFEAKDYVYLYVHGSYAYDQKDWVGVIRNMEESLEAYLQAEDECRASCEGPFDHGWYPDFIPSIANHFTFSARCKRKCPRKLNNLNGERHDDLLPSHYHYLQYAYFKSGNLKAACECVASYLLFYPIDETMLGNMDYYKKLPKFEEGYFTPRTEAIYYVQRRTYEEALLKYVDDNFKMSEIMKDTTEESKRAEVVMDEKQLKGTQRFVSDGSATKKQCQTLIEIARIFGREGDGYDGKSPHTPLERFEGVTLSRVALLVYFGLLDPKYLRIYLKVTEDVKKHLQNYFKLRRELYFTYTHLVCRSALPDGLENRTDLSHAIHADNCNIFPNGTCTRQFPAYTWRDYSAILYLNNDFDGGEFIFSGDMKAEDIQGVVKPKCGRVIGFSSGDENLHGVRAVRKGSRCAVGLWFTFDRSNEEKDRKIAYQLLRK